MNGAPAVDGPGAGGEPVSRRGAARATLVGSSLSMLITLAQAILLIPLCLDQLGARLYGAWLGAAEMLVWVQMLDLGVPNLLMQRIGNALGSGDRESAERWFTSGLAALALLALVLAAIALAISGLLPVWIGVAAEDVPRFVVCFRVGVVASAVLLLHNAFVALARGVQKTALVNASLVAGAICGFLVALGLLLLGQGLWALAWGLVARAVVSLAGGLAFSVSVQRSGLRLYRPPRLDVLREIGRLVPSMGAGSAGYLVAISTEVAVLTLLAGPLVAAVYALTRRAADAARSLIDTVAVAVYGGFAHLMGSRQRERAALVLREILLLRWGVACLAAAVYAALNREFVVLLFGADNWGGIGLTAAFAVRIVIAGQGFLTNYLYRAAGFIREASWLMATEAVLQLVATVACLRLAGPLAVPVVTTILSGGLLLITTRRLRNAMPGSVIPASSVDRRFAWGAAVLVALGVAAGAADGGTSWASLLATGAIVSVAGALILGLLHPHLRSSLLGVAGRVVP